MLRDIDDKQAVMLPIVSITVAINDLLELLAGAVSWTAVTSSSNYFSRKAIALAGSTTADTELLCFELSGREDVEAESANNSDVLLNGDRMLATDTNTVNNAGADNTSQNVIFLQRGTLGAVADKRIWGNVIVGPGVDPDAT